MTQPEPRQSESARDRAVRHAANYLMGSLYLPFGVVLYTLGGWLLVALQCAVFIVAAFVVIAWGACREAAGTTPPRLAFELARLWWRAR